MSNITIVTPQTFTTRAGGNVEDFTITASRFTSIVSSSYISESIFFDYITTVSSSGITGSNFYIYASSSNSNYTYSYSNNTPLYASTSIAINAATCSVMRSPQNGTGSVNASINVTNGKLTRQIKNSVYQSENATFSFREFVSGTLSHNINAYVSKSISGLTYSQSYVQLYVTNESGNVVKNPDLCFQNVDFTCIAYGNNTQYYSMGSGLLVTPYLILGARHVGFDPGESMIFVDKNNTTCSYTIAYTGSIAGTDLRLMFFSSPVTGSITPCKLLDFNDANTKLKASPIFSNSPYLAWKYLPVFGYGDDRVIKIRSYGFMSIYSGSNVLAYDPPTDSYFYDWRDLIHGGDSGSPVFFIINGEIVGLMTWFTTQSGPNISFYMDDIKAHMAFSGSPSPLVTMSLAEFPNVN